LQDINATGMVVGLNGFEMGLILQKARKKARAASA